MYNINKLINSNNEYIHKIGWILYDRQYQNGGLNKNEVDNLIKLLLDLDEDINKYYGNCSDCEFNYTDA